MITRISDEDKFSRNDNVLTTCIDDDLIILLNDEKGGLLGLNSTAKYIWQMLDGSKSLAQIADELYAIYDISREVCLEEARSFIQTLDEHQLLLQEQQ